MSEQGMQAIIKSLNNRLEVSEHRNSLLTTEGIRLRNLEKEHFIKPHNFDHEFEYETLTEDIKIRVGYNEMDGETYDITRLDRQDDKTFCDLEEIREAVKSDYQDIIDFRLIDQAPRIMRGEE